jgi:riboflavin biosynthesis pyrimidine reductase
VFLQDGWVYFNRRVATTLRTQKLLVLFVFLFVKKLVLVCFVAKPSSWLRRRRIVVANRSGGTGSFDDFQHERPHIGQALLDRRHPTQHRCPRDVVRAPAAAAGMRVQDERLQPVEGVGISCLGGFGRLELLPSSAKGRGLVGWQHSEDPLGGGALALRLGVVAGGVVRKRVAGVDFHEVVNCDKFEHAQQVNAGGRVLEQRNRREREVPGVLRRILEPREIDERCATKDCFQLVRLNQKCDLPREPIGSHLMAMISPEQHAARFEAYCRRKEAAACAAPLDGFRMVFDRAPGQGLRPIGNDWTRGLFDGDFYVRESDRPGLPAISLVFVQSREGNTVADDPSTLGGGETDKHLIYEGLSRVTADAVLAGASTARGEETVFSVWHPQLVALRHACGKSRHPAQVVVTASADLPFDRGLMFTTPELPVVIGAPSRVIGSVRERLRERLWIEVVDGGEPLSMTAVMRYVHDRGLRVISAVGGRQTAASLMREGLVRDLYLTTSAISAGEPDTPLLFEEPVQLEPLVDKEGLGAETGVRFQHLTVQS